jgi:hypothetical protein
MAPGVGGYNPGRSLLGLSSGKEGVMNKPKFSTFCVDESEYIEATENYTGWCPVCEEFTRDDTEPDAEDYRCPSCDERHVMGAKFALICGLIEIG